MSEVSFSITREESRLIGMILDRAQRQGDLSPRNRINSEMDITACIANGCPLRLQDWLEADDFNFRHDLYGIDRHMNRDTGKLGGCFLPRFARRDAA